MQQVDSKRYSLLYILWGVLFVLSVVLGFAYPAAEGGLRTALLVISIGFFLPPWIILIRAKSDGCAKHRTIIRYLSLASLIATVLMLVLNLRSVGHSEAVGNALHAILTVVSAPMICGQMYALSLFLWATLLMGSISKLK